MRAYVLGIMLVLSACMASEAPENMENATGSIDPNAPAYCAAVKANIPSQDCELIKQQIDDLKDGMGQLKVPADMVRGTTATVRFSIAPKSPQTNAGAAQPEKPAEDGKPVVELPLKIGRIMSATLEGAAFEITPPGEQLRDLQASDKASWTWSIKAKEKGSQPLYLTVKVKALGRDGKSTELDLYEDYREVTVKVTTTQWLTDQLNAFTQLFTTTEGTLKALAALLAALLAVVLAWRRLFKRSG